MDNITHALAGLLLAESAVQLRARSGGEQVATRFRGAAATASAVAANLPDSDLAYTGVGNDRLSYMLHHRGYTHTIAMALVGAVLLWAIVMVIWRWRARERPSSTDSRWMFGLLTVATLSHLLLDWTNSYGVHLFWPVDNRWQYGDSIFIVEPWLWVVSVPVLVMAGPRRVSRTLLSLALIAVLVVAWLVPFVSNGTAIALTAGTALSIGLARLLPMRARTAIAVAAWVFVSLSMAVGAAITRASVLQSARAADPQSRILDVVISPLPANPFCASVLTVEQSGGVYVVRTARASALPTVLDAEQCRTRSDAASVFNPASRQSTPSVRWEREWSAPAVELATLAREGCRAQAALRFMRVPVWTIVDDSTMLLGDARFGGGSGSSFTDERVPRRSAACPKNLPPWTPPRDDILRAYINGAG